MKRRNAMKVFVRSALLSGALLMGASGLMAQTNDSWREQWFKTKFGSYSPMEQARQRAEAANTAYREEATTETERVAPADAWREQWFKTKFGSYSPMEQARRRAAGR
jgi:hypothetical protein